MYWRDDAGGTRISKDESSRSAIDGSSAAEAIGICVSAIDCAAVGITAVVANESDEGESNGLPVAVADVGKGIDRIYAKQNEPKFGPKHPGVGVRHALTRPAQKRACGLCRAIITNRIKEMRCKVIYLL